MSRDIQQVVAQGLASGNDPAALAQVGAALRQGLPSSAPVPAAAAPVAQPAMPAFTPPQAQYGMPQWAAGLGGNRMQPLYQFRPWGGGGLGFQPSVGGYTGLLNGMIRR